MQGHDANAVTPAPRRSAEAAALIAASPAALFADLDDPRRLGSRMQRRSEMMAGGKMATTSSSRRRYPRNRPRRRMTAPTPRACARRAGTPDTYEPGRRKTSHTVGEPRLLAIGHYRMGVDLSPGAGSRLRVFIDWTPAAGAWAPWAGERYARWCVASMVRDARRHFGRRTGSGAAM